MKNKKKRAYQSSDLVKILAKKFGFEEKLLAFQIKGFLEDYLDDELFKEIGDVNLLDKTLTIKVKSPLLKNDFRMRKTFFIQKFKEVAGEEIVEEVYFV
ncbi:hypothetical protein J5295_05290 [Riemerella anatipestifer]|uniref:DUF721 domain-containing protein n=1 Tax=Riemerella anatipestifer (strain ATCC 11845 / DSM 15868 / JCM 9532 / NCTC 11014) TaxID=693978 RepID=E4TAX9_RIEAD|nr:hypothetical protein [Riemerella anatipestifer]ADQ81215.1 hypothetical protein Riean_0035 [Riemerella anatipestifer ATCC 11845 = DSM 15868]ADZ11302.1 hypothetical protein RIA_0111 [Riemerella anatipestifer RA-GD]AFD55244.1 hypothetical protein RA0C_0236 [Riemerella anatipestifer ATCC 11845 = DSM 15868]AGC40902.1 hypothetical protein G148_1598 [Riemerella anatipestifer RA-CH-2]AKP68521.1 hypothetical protein CG08_0031 [Riemerella anatipestifer]